MAKKIEQRIALLGDEEIKKQLLALGATGEEAFKKLEVAAKAAADAQAQAGDGSLSAGEKVLATAGTLGVLTIAAYKLGRAFVSAAEDAAKNAKAISDAATKSGQSLQGYQEQIAVLEKTGLSHEQAEQAVKRFGQAATDAYTKGRERLKALGAVFPETAAGQEALNDQLARTGVVIKNVADAKDAVAQLNTALAASKGLFNPETNAVTPDIAGWQRFVEVIRSIQDPLVRAKTLTLAFTEEFGRLFNQKVIQGKTPLADFLAEFKAEGGALSKEADKSLADFRKVMADLNRIQGNANRDTGVKLAEFLTPIIQEMNRVIPIINGQIDKLIEDAGKAAQAPLQRGKSEIQGIIDDLSNADILGALKKIDTSTAIDWSGAKNEALAVWEAIKQAVIASFNQMAQEGQAAFNSIWAGIAAGASSMWQQIQQDAETAVNFIVGLWERVKQAIRDVPSANNTAGAPLGDVQFAGGGYTGNRGVGRIAGVVHGQEYVQPAHVVRKPGVLAFLEILRRTGDLHAAIARFSRGYSSGGLVDSINASMARNFAIPGLRGFASGGFVGGSTSNVTIQFPGVPDIVGLRASSDVVDQLRKAAAMAQVRSGGRKPSRYG